jgi:hypothetical protein
LKNSPPGDEMKGREGQDPGGDAHASQRPEG